MSSEIRISLPLTPGDTPVIQMLAALAGITTSLAQPATGSPADPTQAPTSPEGASIMIFNGAVTGPSFLKDAEGLIYSLAIKPGSSPPFGVAAVSGTTIQGGGAVQGIDQLEMRAGQVWFVLQNGGQTQYWNPTMGTLYNGVMPAPASAPVPALPVLPTPSAIAPGSSGRIIQCGSGQALATLSDAIPTALAGDTIKVAPGTYTDTPPAWVVPLLIDLGGATFDVTGQTATLARGKGLLVPAADSIIQNGTITGVAMDQTEGQLTSAIRPDAGCGYLTISGLVAHGNQCAVGHGGFPCVIELQASDISGNGLKVNAGALTHNLYVGQDCVKLTLTDVISTDPVEAHAIKYRGPELIVTGGTFASGPGKPFDLPNGCTVPFSITGATILKAATDADHGILACGEEGATNGLAGGTINGGTIQADCPNPQILGPGGTITLAGVTKTGNPITASGGIVLA